MKQFLSTLPRNIIGCFKGQMILWHVIGDRPHFHPRHVRLSTGSTSAPPAIRSFVPGCFPPLRSADSCPLFCRSSFWRSAALARSAKVSLAGWAVGQTELIGALVAAAYKAITGRAHPSHEYRRRYQPRLPIRLPARRGLLGLAFLSHHHRVRHGRHDIYALPETRWLGYLAIAYALYIGIGVSMTIHWFSDFAAGAIIGTAIGTVVGRSFSRGQM